MVPTPGVPCYVASVQRRALAAWCAACLLGAVGCGEDASTTVTRTIGPEGGQVSSHDGVLTVLFLPGALEENQEISIAPSDAPPKAFGPVYRVKPDVDLKIGAEVSFQHPLPDDEDTAAVGAIRREAFASGNARWVSLGRSELSESADFVAAIDGELSMFYTVLDSGVAGTTTGPPSTGTGTMNATEPGTTGPTTTGIPPDLGGDTDPTTGGGPISHAADIQPIWDDNCLRAVGCHVAGGAVPNLETDAYNNVINAASAVATASLVTPGDPTTSYLMHKLDATHSLDANLGGCGCAGAGNSMPSGANLLPEGPRTLIRDWITQGAEP